MVSASTSPSLLGQGREMVRALPAGRGGTRGEGTSLIAQLPSVTVQQHFCPKPSPVPAESAGAGTKSQDKLLQGFLAQRKKSEGSQLPASPRNSPSFLLPQAPSSSRGCCRFRWVRNRTAEGESNRRERKKLEAEGYSREISA